MEKFNFTRDELIEHVKDGDEVGEKITEVEMEFLRSLKNWQNELKQES